MTSSVAALLLAAGQSNRFGVADKLEVMLGDRPLGSHAAGALMAIDFAARFVVVGRSTIAWPGFEVIANARPEIGIAASIALGMAAVRRANASAVLIALADMPFVEDAHVRRLLARYRGPETRVASGDGNRRMPPALFGSSCFDALESLTGDRGAASLLDKADIVFTSVESLFDIDRREDLDQAAARSV